MVAGPALEVEAGTVTVVWIYRNRQPFPIILYPARPSP
jgi:hypothetical protein